MKIKNIIKLCVFVLSIFTVNVFSLNTFDGTKIIVDAPANGGMSALRYLSGDVYAHTTSTLSVCPGQGTPVYLGGGVWQIPRNTTNGYWCFQSNDASHLVSWDNVALATKYKWLPNNNSTGFQNVKDFGAIGDGTANDTAAIVNALLYLASKQGGTLYIPRGTFKVTDTITLPPGILIQGTLGRAGTLYTNPGACRIKLEGENKPLFRIGEDSENIRLKNIELTASSNNGTVGVEGVGKFNVQQDNSILGSTQVISFDNMIFSNFDKGIYARLASGGVDWQFDYIKVESCMFMYNKTAGIYSEVANSDWNIISSIFYLPKKETGVEADGMFFHRALAVLVQNTFGGGDGPARRGGDFLDVLSLTTLQLLNNQCESTTNTLVFGNHPDAGNLATTLNLVGNTFGDPIKIERRVTFISTGNSYGGKSVTANNDKVMIYSNGDRFCEDSYFIGGIGSNCGYPNNTGIGFQGIGKIVFQSGQVKDGIIAGRDAKFGTDVEIAGDNPDLETKPILKVSTPHFPGQGKNFFEMSQGAFTYSMGRDRNTGFLKFSGTQGTPWQGYIFDAPVTFPSKTLNDIWNEGIAPYGSAIFCTNCVPNSAPCATGGSGALAVKSPSGWNC